MSKAANDNESSDTGMRSHYDRRFRRTRLSRASGQFLARSRGIRWLRHDCNIKLPIYARAGSPKVWIVNAVNRQLEVYRKPKRSRYGELLTYAEGVTVAPPAFPESQLDWWS